MRADPAWREGASLVEREVAWVRGVEQLSSRLGLVLGDEDQAGARRHERNLCVSEVRCSGGLQTRKRNYLTQIYEKGRRSPVAPNQTGTATTGITQPSMSPPPSPEATKTAHASQPWHHDHSL
jgi:hypothetical protein